MGLFEKIKNVFYDEEIIEVPEEKVKREEVKPKIEKVDRVEPKEEVKPKVEAPTFTEREIFKTESAPTFKFPILDEEEPKTRSRITPVIEEKPSKRENKYADMFKQKTTNEPKPERVFKPSPVISPVYGVLDKNYTKEEIIERQQSTQTRSTSPKDMNYDAVRRKAYGTLEDELESTLTEISETKDYDTEEKNDNKSIEDLLNEIEGNKNMSIGEIEEKIKDKMEEEEQEDNSNISELIGKIENDESVEDEKDEGYDKTLEHDLFNLIDSMYEEKEGE